MLKTLQIAILGGNKDAVLVGIRTFPVHKLVLISLAKDRSVATQLKYGLQSVLKVPVDIYTIESPSIRSMLEVFATILDKEKESYEDIIINLGGGDKYITCAATTSSFINGLKAFEVMNDKVEMLPIMKLSYNEIISRAKFDILRSIEKVGGEVESLEKLREVSGYGKPLLSYHIQGAEDSRGLIELGLVEVERGARGRTKIRITTLGEVLLLAGEA